MKNEHLNVGIGGGWINENEVNFHLFLEMKMITFEDIMRDGGEFYLMKYDGSEIKTFPYSMVWYTKDSEVINIEGESFFDNRHTCLMVADRKDEDKSYVFDGIFMFVADDRCLDEARMVFIDKLVEKKRGEIGEMKEKIKSFKKEMRILKRLKK